MIGRYLVQGKPALLITRSIASSSIIRAGTAATTTSNTTATNSFKKASPTSTTTSTTLKGYNTTLNSSLKGKVLQEIPNTDTIDNKASKNANDVDWSTSWYGLGMKPFADSIQEKLLQPLEANDIEIKPDGLLYLPEIKYRRILNKAFGAGGWGLVPRSETIVTTSLVTREYGLICNGQLVGVARGEQDYFNDNGIPTATEGCKSNALMRCCKDLGIGSELWDPVFIKKYKETYCIDKFVEHITTKKKKKIWLRKDRKVEYPYK
ncbi:similar to Saccharomyces cerevisiae YJR144W MGM101 Protein involved in mitochondrial genome maintenance [Maudiozyma saulgeensis]|uniref:Mitochondrial genome maintenance protein MGM101 n=1 Tax=Maudiozyma saulgeensis TaxID=1789683 RepID=A0A1X7R1M1_9SACH|nr:similar to Saccharomyces cerevisiae YJR144W MGM101 Protein involved in mitochondrial genome maintenance [Kazachstania saulgeensis]